MELSDYDDLLLFIITVVLVVLMAKYVKPLSSETRNNSASSRRPLSNVVSETHNHKRPPFILEREKHLIEIKSEQQRSWPYYVRQSVKLFNNEIHKVGLRGFDWQEFSPLKYYGYTVGKSKGLRFEQRQLVMTITFYADLPEIFPEAYRQRWGGAGTYRRYKQIADHINMLYERNSGISRMSYAVADWEQDHIWFLSQYSKLANIRKACGL
ncbi:MAG: hypothetical protein CSH37_13530 [Thalassolituus sp.]|nr:MAG: hypothetical protein CSH37_13530 [Thalassolituus sp.]